MLSKALCSPEASEMQNTRVLVFHSEQVQPSATLHVQPYQLISTMLQLQHRLVLAQRVGKAKLIGGDGKHRDYWKDLGNIVLGEEKHGLSLIN